MPPVIKHRDVLLILQVRLRDLAIFQDQAVKEFSTQMSKINDQISETDQIISALLVQDSDELQEPVTNHGINAENGVVTKDLSSRIRCKDLSSRRAFDVYMGRKLTEEVLEEGLTSFIPDWRKIRIFLMKHAIEPEVCNSENGINDDFLAPAKKKIVRFSSAAIEEKHKMELFEIVKGVRTKRKNRNTQALKTKSKLESKSLSDSSEESDTDDEEEIVVNGAEEQKKNDHPLRLKFLAFLSRMWMSLDFDLFGKGDDKVTGLKSSDIQESFALHVHNFINADRTSIGLYNPIQYKEKLLKEIKLPTHKRNFYSLFIYLTNLI